MVVTWVGHASVLIQTQDSVGDNTGTDVLPPNYLAGLDLGINALDPANDIDIAAGAARVPQPGTPGDGRWPALR